MAVYDDEKEKLDDLHKLTGIGPDEEKAMENRAYSGAAADIAEREQLDRKLPDITDKNIDGAEDSGDSFYKPSKKKSATKGKGRTRGNALKAGIAGGVIGGFVTLGGFLGFLRTFQLDNLFKNIDTKAYQRVSANLDTRNKYLMRAYIKARITEPEGKVGESVYFKANKIDSNHPMTDWYRTLRKNKFEEKLLNEQGVFFTTMADGEGNISWGKFTGRDSVDPALVQKYNLTSMNSENFTTILNRIDADNPDDIEKIFTVDRSGSHKEARRQAREIARDNIPWFRVWQRRQARKDQQNATGIKNWRLFDTTRTKLEERKRKINDAIIEKSFSGNPTTQNILKCLFSSGSCGATSDPEAPENKAGGTAAGDGIDGGDKAETNAGATTDENGNVVRRDISGETGAIADETSEVLKNAAQSQTIEEIEEEATEAIVKTAGGGASRELEEQAANRAAKRIAGAGYSQKVVLGLIAKMTGKTVAEVAATSIPIPSPDKVWTWAKRLAFIHGLFGSNGEGDSQLTKMVKTARRSQQIGVYSTYAIANSQLKSGDLIGTQLSDFFTTLNNLGNSEGWAMLTGQNIGAKAGSVAKETYCNDETYQRKPTDFAYYCNNERPDNGGNAEGLSNAYNASIGPVIAPVATAVRSVEDGPVGTVLSAITDAFSKVTEPAITYIMEQTGLQKTFGSVVGDLMERLLQFLGATPMFDPYMPNNVGNMVVAGGIASAEASMRASGAIKTTPEARAYSDNLTQAYLQEKENNKSWRERYISLEAGDSLASRSLANMGSISASKSMASISSALTSMPRTLGSIFSSRAAAQTTNADLVKWSGADRYDMPKVCMELDPMQNDLYAGTNYDEVTGQRDLDWDTVRNNDKFFPKVYTWAGKDPAKLDTAETIYSCHIQDARAMGSIGYLSGYDEDGGLVTQGSTASADKSATGNIAPGALAWPIEGEGGDGVSRCLRPGHDGWDIFSNQVPAPKIFASSDGVVTRSEAPGSTGGFGYMVTIYHESLDVTGYYPHLASQSSLKVGEKVKQGQYIGDMGNSGESRGVHLHFQLMKGNDSSGHGQTVNPIDVGMKVPDKFANSCAKTGVG